MEERKSGQLSTCKSYVHCCFLKLQSGEHAAIVCLYAPRWNPLLNLLLMEFDYTAIKLCEPTWYFQAARFQSKFSR